MNPIQEVERVSRTRGSIYSFLSRAFKNEIDRSFLKTIEIAGPTIKRLANSQEGADLIDGSERLERFIQQIEKLSDDKRDGLMTELRVEFTNLFLGVGDDTVHLVESAYLNRKRMRYEKPAEDLRAAYESVGFKKDGEFFEPEDHFALEFEFMARLCNWTADELVKDDVENAIAYLSLQKEFLGDHVSRWVPKLCDHLKRKARSDFYSCLAYLTNGLVEMDEEMPVQLIMMLKEKLAKDAAR
jgi:putative dimethyl sulfoxide reductase chaperone